MKTSHLISALILLFMLVISSCKEVKVTTKVNADGSFTRIVTVTGDSTEVLSRNLPFPVDSTWTRTSSKDTTEKGKFIVEYSKSYKNSGKLNEEIRRDTSEYNLLDKEIIVQKRFGFFFSYVTYKEVYKCVNPFHSLDYKKYVSGDEIKITNGQVTPKTRADSTFKKSAENNILDYVLQSAVLELESITGEGIQKLNDPRPDQADISKSHDSLVAYLYKNDLKYGRDLPALYAKWSGDQSFLKLNDIKPYIYESFDKKIEKLDEIFKLSGYKEEVEMPGLITATNSEMLQGNKVGWDFEIVSLLATDSEYFVESRVVNYWAFVLSGAVVLAMIILLAVKAVRR